MKNMLSHYRYEALLGALGLLLFFLWSYDTYKGCPIAVSGLINCTPTPSYWALVGIPVLILLGLVKSVSEIVIKWFAISIVLSILIGEYWLWVVQSDLGYTIAVYASVLGTVWLALPQPFKRPTLRRWVSVLIIFNIVWALLLTLYSIGLPFSL